MLTTTANTKPVCKNCEKTSSLTLNKNNQGSELAAMKLMEDSSCQIKDVVIIGNGPSAITLSYFLAGNVPYYKGESEDDLLHKRLTKLDNPDETLVLRNLQDLATGCEGRSNNPVSVFFDKLNHPEADIGLERESLLDWKFRPELAMNHVVLGKGLPGGCWKSLEGDVQTVSLGNWMELPDLKMAEVSDGIRDANSRILVADVAKYYQKYVKVKGLQSYFVNNFEVTSIREVTKGSARSELSQNNSKSSDLSVCEDNAIFSYDIMNNQDFNGSEMACSCSTEEENSSAASLSSSSCNSEWSNENDKLDYDGGKQLTSFSHPSLGSSHYGVTIQNHYLHLMQNHGETDISDIGNCSHFDECSARDGDLEEFTMNICCSWNPIVNPKLFCSIGSMNRSLSNSLTHCSTSLTTHNNPLSNYVSCDSSKLFEVSGVITETNSKTGEIITRSTKYLTKEIVLATGSYDLPNQLNIPGENFSFVLHSLKELEHVFSEINSDPILVVGAGLSAADAIIAANNESVSVIHSFRRSIHDPSLIFKMLPKALYPEYHKVYNMMKGEIPTQFYKALSEHNVIEILPNRKVIIRHDLTGELMTISVSYVVVLIGSSPDLDFMEPAMRSKLGIIKNVPISRNNPIDIDLFTNEIVNLPGVYAMGPLVGDNFVRFLQGGALAITNNILKKQSNSLT